MNGRRASISILSMIVAVLLIALVCEAQTIRSQYKFGLVEGMTGVITNIGGTRVTISSQETNESFTVHMREVGDLKVGDFVQMEGGRPVKVEMPVKTDTAVEPPKQVETQKVEATQPAATAPQPQPRPSEPLEPASSEPPKPSPNAQK